MQTRVAGRHIIYTGSSSRIAFISRESGNYIVRAKWIATK